MDRRILKTRQAIMEAFVGLMGENDFEKITIHAIAERANVNRGTVYLHFTDKFDLLDQCIDTYLQYLYESCMPDGDASIESAKALLLRTFEFLERNAPVYSTLLTGKGAPAFRKRMEAMVQAGIKEHLASCDIHPGIRQEILVQFLSVAVAGLVEWWIEHAMPYPPSEMVDQLVPMLERNLIWQGHQLPKQ